jgi:hypothetical protein
MSVELAGQNSSRLIVPMPDTWPIYLLCVAYLIASPLMAWWVQTRHRATQENGKRIADTLAETRSPRLDCANFLPQSLGQT